MEECGYGYIWHYPLSYNTNAPQIINSIHQRLKDIYLQTFFKEIYNHNRGGLAKNKLRTYRLFKLAYNEEQYLNIDNIRHRTTVTKLRISCHKLHIETGRHNRTPLEQRTCRYCNLDKLEDEHHFVVECSLYNSERIELYRLITSMFPHFIHLSNADKFTFLMILDKPLILKHVCSYLCTITEKRGKVEYT